MAEKEFSVESTQTLADWRGFYLRRDDFDKYLFKETRDEVLKRLDPDSSFEWISERIEAYIEIQNFETVLMLLRQFSRLSWHQKEATALIVKSADKILEYAERTGYKEPLKEVIVILCGKINFYKELYDDSVRNIFKRVIKKYYPGWYGTAEEEARLISRILFPIMHVKDVYFLPILEAKGPINKKELDHLMKYASVCKERVQLEALRLLAIKYLES